MNKNNPSPKIQEQIIAPYFLIPNSFFSHLTQRLPFYQQDFSQNNEATRNLQQNSKQIIASAGKQIWEMKQLNQLFLQDFKNVLKFSQKKEKIEKDEEIDCFDDSSSWQNLQQFPKLNRLSIKKLLRFFKEEQQSQAQLDRSKASLTVSQCLNMIRKDKLLQLINNFQGYEESLKEAKKLHSFLPQESSQKVFKNILQVLNVEMLKMQNAFCYELRDMKFNVNKEKEAKSIRECKQLFGTIDEESASNDMNMQPEAEYQD